MVRDTGWGWDEALDTLTVSRAAALQRSWQKTPPLHKMVAAFAGYKPQSQVKLEPMTGEMAEALIKYRGGALI